MQYPSSKADQLMVLDLIDLGFTRTAELRSRTHWNERRVLRRVRDLIAQDLVVIAREERNYPPVRYYALTDQGHVALSQGVLQGV